MLVRNIPMMFGFRPLKTIFVLLLIILLLALLLMFYGLGGGGGKSLPGSSDTPSLSLETPNEEKTPTEDKNRPAVRRELNISFIPSESDPEFAKELICTVSWIDPATRSHETRLLSEDNMPDFEFSLEKLTRAWYVAAPVSTNRDIPIVAVGMIPFPGEGTLQKITKIVHDIDPRIGILRLEKK